MKTYEDEDKDQNLTLRQSEWHQIIRTLNATVFMIFIFVVAVGGAFFFKWLKS